MKNIIDNIKEELNDNIFWLLDKWFDANEENKQDFIELISMYKKDKSVITNFVNSIDLQKLKEFITFLYDDPAMKFDDNSNYEYILKNILDKIISNKSMFNKYNKENKVSEGLKLGKNFKYNELKYFPKDKDELIKIIKDILIDNKNEEYINLNDIDTSKITDFSKLFASNNDIKYIDISKWNTKNVTKMSYMFDKCKNLVSVGKLDDWNVSAVSAFTCMFNACENLEEIGDISKWDVSFAENMQNMFSKCRKIKNLGDLSTWKLDKIKNISQMFFGLRYLDTSFANSWKEFFNSYGKNKDMAFSFTKNAPAWGK